MLLNRRLFFQSPWPLLLGFFLLHLFLSFQITLGTDEAHYALYGLHLDWSYFDHPPLVGWVEAFFQFVFGRSEAAVRLPANLCGLISGLLAYRLAFQISGEHRAAWMATLAMNLSFLILGLSLMFLPDSLLLPLSLWLALIMVRLIEKNQWSDWLQLGLCLGLAGLAKYTAILFVISLIILAFTEKRWRRWLSWKLAVAVSLSVFCISPVLYWNHLHHWISFAYQTGHLAGEKGLSWNVFFQSLLAQFVAYSPFLILTSVAGIVLSHSRLPLAARVLLWIAIPCFVFFTFSGFKNFVLPHWPLTVYAQLIVVGTSLGFLLVPLRPWIRWSCALSGLVILILLSELCLRWFPFQDYQTAYADLTGWHELHDEIKSFKQDHPDQKFSIGVSNWTLGSRTAYYFFDLADVFVLDNHFDQFDIWEEQQKAEKDFLLVHWKGFDFPLPLDQMCESHQVVKENIFRGNTYVITKADLILCRGLKTSLLSPL